MSAVEHDPNWVETKTQGDTVYFRCSICGRTATGSMSQYYKGKWMPSSSVHDKGAK